MANTLVRAVLLTSVGCISLRGKIVIKTSDDKCWFVGLKKTSQISWSFCSVLNHDK